MSGMHKREHSLKMREEAVLKRERAVADKVIN
jgi:hypothetical protein